MCVRRFLLLAELFLPEPTAPQQVATRREAAKQKS